ncbi:hypothetical protein GCM10027347_25220 [Larkinella harenae]
MLTRNWTVYLELAARYYVFLILNLYGWAKTIGHQFFRPGHFPADVASIPLAEANGFQLAWTFFGYSTGYIVFIGLSQVVGAWLLLWEKTKLIGTVLLLPILLNIIVVDLAYQISVGALTVASTCLVLLVLILWLNQSVLRAVFELIFQQQVSESMALKERGIALAVALGIMGLLIGLLQVVGRFE